jgi:hypothetical protein
MADGASCCGSSFAGYFVAGALGLVAGIGSIALQRSLKQR